MINKPDEKGDCFKGDGISIIPRKGMNMFFAWLSTIIISPFAMMALISTLLLWLSKEDVTHIQII